MTPGKVYLVGAGPGDPGLITVKGLEYLKRADVVVYDRLIDDSLLANARPDAEMVYVGKSAKTHAREQDEIDRLLVERAREGKVVVRLKGADPLVLGRGGEEAEALAAEGIRFEIVPGVSSAIGVPAYAGIPVTHRKVASSFAVVTGHEDPTKESSSIKWDKLATGVDTLVFLMGMGNLRLIVSKLIECGRLPATPVALVREGTTVRQETVVGTLETIGEKAEAAGLQPPVAMVVGDVVVLREKLAWFESRPLFGKKVLVTRSRSQASDLSRMLTERGAAPVELPTIEIKDVPVPNEFDDAIKRLTEFDWVIFTSANGVEALWRRMRAHGLDARAINGVRVGAIGPATGAALAERGMHADFMPDEYTTEGMLAGLERLNVRGGRMLLPRANIAPRDLAEGLARLGAEPREVTAYITELPADTDSTGRQMLVDGTIDVITFSSSSTVTNLRRLLGADWQAAKKATIACIGPRTAATASEEGLNVDIVAEEQTIPGLVRAIEVYFEGGR